MEHLPNVDPAPDDPVEKTAERPKPEIFVRPESEPEQRDEPESPAAFKKKRSYNRDPVEMKQHMVNMRAKAIESRRKKKAAAELAKKGPELRSDASRPTPIPPKPINTGYVK